jgi:Uma2 family endonuclease
MSTVASRLMTAEEFWEWVHRPENEGRSWELEAGEVVEMPSPGELHGVLCAWITALLWRYVAQRGRGYVCSNDTGLAVKRDPDTVRGPDIMFFAESRTLDKMNRKFATNTPALIVEVLSPTDQLTRVNRRISQYLQRGVPLVWLVDGEVRSVSVYRAGGFHSVLDEADELTGEEVLADLRLRVAELFTLPGETKEG